MNNLFYLNRINSSWLTKMIGVFSKDVWGIIFEKLETEYDPVSLNNLSLTCKRLNILFSYMKTKYRFRINLNTIDNLRKKNYINELYDTRLTKEEMKGRHNYVELIAHSYVTQYLVRYGLKEKRYCKEIYAWLKELDVRTLGITKKLLKTK